MRATCTRSSAVWRVLTKRLSMALIFEIQTKNYLPYSLNKITHCIFHIEMRTSQIYTSSHPYTVYLWPVLRHDNQTTHLFTQSLNLFLKVNHTVLTYVTTTQTPYLHNLISVQRHRRTRSSSVVTLAWQRTSSFVKITDRSNRYASPCLWNQLPLHLRQPHSGTSSSIFYSPIPSPITSSSFVSPLCSSITPSLSLPA